MFTFGFETKYLADSVSNSSKVKQTLHCGNVISVIARHGRRFRKIRKNLETKITRSAGQ